MSTTAFQPASTTEEVRQYSTFYLGDRLYGIDVTQVQEITKGLPMTPVPLGPRYVHGLINLRGQISTAVGLRSLFHLEGADDQDSMHVVCNVDGILLSLVVDRIGDVKEVSSKDFENTPETVDGDIRKFMHGVYKLPREILSILEIKNVLLAINA